MEKINLIALKKFADRIIYQPEDGFTNLSTLLMRLNIENESLTIEEIQERIYSYLNEYCSLDDYYTWTSHGSWIWHSWKRVRAKLEGMGF